MNKKGFTHDSQKMISEDWYTPEWIFKTINTTFDIDVCGPEGGVKWIPAKKTYSIKDDGLKCKWYGKVWLNPPYGRETKIWLEKMCEHNNGIALVFARTDCGWFHEYASKAKRILFLKGRVNFVDAMNKTGNSGPGSGSMLLGYGKCYKYLYNFHDLGMIIKPRSI